MKGWIENKIGELIKELPKSKIMVSDASDFGVFPFYTSGDNILKYHTFLIDDENIFLATGGVANVKYYNGKTSYSTDTYVVCGDNIDTKYLYYFFLNIIEFINIHFFHGSGLKHLQKKDFKNFQFYHPKSLPEQKKIAQILSTIDNVIEQTQKLIAKYKHIKTGLMQDLLTKGIDKNGNIRTEETHKFKDSPLGRIPEEWEVDKLEKCSILLNNLRKPISALEREHMIGDYPYYGATGIIDYINEFRINGKCVLMGEDGDHFLKFKSQEMTILVDGKFNVSNHAHILQGKPNCNTEWIHYYFSHKDITYYLTRQGAGRFKLNKESLQNLPILLPKPKEQIRISDFIQNFNKTIDIYNKEINKLQKQKTGLMQDLLTGKVRVTELLGKK
ncbi:MAG: restriction endonuclease subunit S [Bacteroidales bacterium]|nr:restriction endonuclease subunit S [Bacteroidales bacterium]